MAMPQAVHLYRKLGLSSYRLRDSLALRTPITMCVVLAPYYFCMWAHISDTITYVQDLIELIKYLLSVHALYA